jgi:hypothetical protein
MITIELSNASNGLIKKITDTNYNGAGERFEEVLVYQIDNKETRFEAITDFLYELSADLGLDLGSDFSNAQLSIDVDWGENYIATNEEIDERLKDLQDEIKFLKALKKSKEGNI